MKQSLILSILLLLLSSSSPISARDKANPEKSPAPSSLETPAPGPSNSDCSTKIYDMMDCLNYLSVGSNDTKPEKSCCVGIESVLEYNPHCICVGLETSTQMGIPLNTSRALAMPTTCKLSIAAPQCDVSISGALSPGASTSGISPIAPSVGTPTTSPSSSVPSPSPSVTSPSSSATSPSSTESPTLTAPSPSRSATTKRLIPIFSLVTTIVSSFVYISAFSS